MKTPFESGFGAVPKLVKNKVYVCHIFAHKYNAKGKGQDVQTCKVRNYFSTDCILYRAMVIWSRQAGIINHATFPESFLQLSWDWTVAIVLDGDMYNVICNELQNKSIANNVNDSGQVVTRDIVEHQMRNA